MNRMYFKLVTFMLFPFIVFGQQTNKDCSRIKRGTFYFYPTNSSMKFKIIRDDSTQREINLILKDTSMWRTTWKNNCILELKLIWKNHYLSDAEKSFYQSHVTIMQIKEVKEEYYVFSASLDSLTNMKTLMDTLWIKPK